MDANAPEPCDFCGRAARSPVHEDGTYCSQGCRQVASTLPPVDAEESVTSASPEDESPAEEHDRAFYHVAGMHSPTCEAFLERRANAQAGVHGAEASYVTETIRLEYDPATCDPDKVADHLQTAGYRLVSRDATSGESMTTARSRDAADETTRNLEDLLGFRYAAGVVFGSFMLLPYIIVLYPAHLSALFGAPPGFFEGGELGADALLLVPLFLGVTGVVVFFTGLPLLRGASVSLRMRRPNADLLVVLTIFSAYTYSTIALLLGRLDLFFDLTIVVAATVVAGVFYESLVKQRAIEQLTDLTISQTDEARVLLPSGTATVDVADLRPGDRVLVREGERIPVDGTLDEGRCTVDESVVTGESRPVHKHAGEAVVGGAVVRDGAATVRVGDPPTSRIDRLTTAVWTLQSGTHGLQRRTDAVAARVTPLLLLGTVAAVLVGLVLGASTTSSLLLGLGFLLAACPWALGLSTPLSVATNIKAALARRILVFDETVFERLRDNDVVVLDKTGTLTVGELQVVSASVDDALLRDTAALERYAAHPAASAITAYADTTRRTDGVGQGGTPGVDDCPDMQSGERTDEPAVTDFESHSLGVEGVADDHAYLVGHPNLFDERDWELPASIRSQAADARSAGHLPVVIGRDGQAAGLVVLGDEEREGWTDLVTALAARDVEIIVLTGDADEAAAVFSAHPAIDHVFTEIPPAGKTETITRLQADSFVTMVGDGTNDGPALAQADLGIALGSGTALASDAADVAILDDDLGRIRQTFALAAAAKSRVR